MTIDEANDFLRQAFIAFPGVLQWVKDNSPDTKATLQLWAKNLSKVTAQEALSVLSRWSSNELPPPSGYQRELFINHVIAVVQQDRSKTHAAKHRDKVFNQLNLNGQRQKYTPVCGAFIKDVMAIKHSYDLGQICYEELQAQVAEREAKALEDVCK